MFNKEIIIEPATTQDADVAAKLTFMAYHKYSYDVLGKIGEQKATERYKLLWMHGDNRFGHYHSYIAKIDGQVAGMMTCYAAPLIKKLVKPTLFELVRMGGVSFILHLLLNLSNFYYFARNHDVTSDEFYIATLAVVPEYRRYGVGTNLLKHAINLAKNEQLRFCSLHVSAENEKAINFYEGNGFVKTKPLTNTSTPPTFYRMVHTLNYVIT